jgi:hypothetical protein
MRQTTISLAVVALVMAACGGGDDDANSAAADQPAAAESAAEPAADEPAADEPAADEPAAADEAPSLGVAENTAIVTIGDKTYEIDVTASAIQRCDPNFFGAFWALGGIGGNGIDMLLPPPGDPNFEDAPYINVGDEERDIEWVANADREMAGVEAGESQVDTFTVDGLRVTGTATFVDLNESYAFQGGVGDEPQPVTGTFEVLCAAG